MHKYSRGNAVINEVQELQKNLTMEEAALNLLEEWICSIEAGFTHAVSLTFCKNGKRLNNSRENTKNNFALS